MMKVSVLALGLAFGASTFGASAETLTLVNSDAIGSPIDRMNEYFAKEVTERSGGDLTINYIPGQQLGSAPQVMDQLSAGTVDMFGNSAAWFTPYSQDTQILTWGFTFRDADHMQGFLESDLFDSVVEEMRETDRIRVLAAAPLESRIVFSAAPLDSADDFQGLKMRVPQITAYLELWKALGAQPTQVAWGEVFLALSTGVVDAAEGPTGAGYAQRFHEAAPHVYLTDHLFDTTMFAINEDRFQALSEEHQALLTEVAAEAVRWIREETEAARDETLDAMRAEGASVNEIDVEPLREAALAAVPQMEASGLWSEGLFEEVQSF